MTTSDGYEYPDEAGYPDGTGTLDEGEADDAAERSSDDSGDPGNSSGSDVVDDKDERAREAEAAAGTGQPGTSQPAEGQPVTPAQTGVGGSDAASQEAAEVQAYAEADEEDLGV